MTVVAIHQPNYLPWLGYFHKMMRADVFLLLDDVQYSKGSYINRVQVRSGAEAEPRWLTVPVAVTLGQTIAETCPNQPGWARRHLDTLRNFYKGAAHFRDTWARLGELYADLPEADLATVNEALLRRLASALGMTCTFRRSSELAVGAVASDDRLVALVRAVDPAGCYYSGKGGAKYQDPAKFAAAGLGFGYSDFRHPVYDQGGAPFLPGLSVIDALFHLGFAGTAALLREGA